MNTDLPPRLKDLLGEVGERLGLGDARATGLLWTHWTEIVGEGVAQNAEPSSLKDGVLRIRTTSPAWAQELTYLAGEIRSRANALSGSQVVREVRVWTGPGPVARTTSKSAPGHQDERDELDELDGESPPEDLPTAFARAHEAWARRRAKNR